MKNLVIVISFLLSFFGMSYHIQACSPLVPTISELIEEYNEGKLLLVEGYYLPEKGKTFVSKFIVTRSSVSSIKEGMNYDVYEYGPFGSRCEYHELKANIDENEAGEARHRLLFIYKDRSKGGKLVTPIFWQGGMKILDNKIISEDSGYDYEKNKYYLCQYSASYTDFWKKLLLKEKINVKDWQKKCD